MEVGGRDRTKLNREFMYLIALGENWDYKRIAKEALELHKQGLRYVKIVEILGVTDKTVKKAKDHNKGKASPNMLAHDSSDCS